MRRLLATAHPSFLEAETVVVGALVLRAIQEVAHERPHGLPSAS